MPSQSHEHWMLFALAQADLAAQHGDVPVGCVVVDEHDTLVATGRNQRQMLQDPTAHAEVQALRQAAQVTGHWRLNCCTLYVTLEPCPMCAGALVNARIKTLVFGCRDPKAGAVVTMMQLACDPRLNHQCEIVEGVLSTQCAERLVSFFAQLRAQGKK